MSSSFCDKVLVLKYKIECERSSIFGESLKNPTECHTEETCIYQSMCALIEKMVNLNKSKKG